MNYIDQIPMPPKGEHPRVFLRKTNMYEIREKWQLKGMKDVYYQLKAYANIGTDPVFDDNRNRSLGLYGNEIFESIKANAFFYLFEEDAAAGRKAIEMLGKVTGSICFDKSPVFDELPTRAGGELLVVIAVVYDWCYDILSNEEKEKLRGDAVTIMKGMEVGYPPVQQGSVTSHSGEAQLMRDIISAAIAFFDEDPSLYMLVAKRLFEEFIPARNYIYKSHSYHQGDFYSTFRYQWEIYLAWIYRRMGYDRIFSPDQQYVPYSWLYQRLPNGQMIRDGDSVLSTLTDVPYWTRCYMRSFMLAASYYKDPYLQSEYHRCDPYGRYEPIDGAAHPLEKLLFYSPDVKDGDLKKLHLSKIFNEPYGGLIARSSFDPEDKNTVVCSFKIGNRMFKNHQHRDSGQFQIFYKDFLAMDTGLYYSAVPQIAYRSEHHEQYVKRTIAHNCMLFKNSKLLMDDGGQRCDIGDPHYLSIYELLNDPDSLFAKTVASHADDTLSYASAELTPAYRDRVKYYYRSFAVLFTGDVKAPAVVMVYDTYEPISGGIVPYWLLHTQNRPKKAGDRYYVQNKGCMLISLFSSVEYSTTMVGGPGHEFDVFGINYPGVTVAAANTEEGQWRLQTRLSGGKQGSVMAVMVIADTLSDADSIDVKVQHVNDGCIVCVKGQELRFMSKGRIVSGNTSSELR